MPGARLDDVLITNELAGRPSRAPDYEAEAAAITRLTEALGQSSGDALQQLADTIVRMDIAASAGVSIREADDDGSKSRWRAVSGAWRGYVGVALPLDETPCGFAMTHHDAALFLQPERFFTELSVSPPVHEILLIPFRVRGELIGVVWAASHDGTRPFETEDARLLDRLAAFASVAYRFEQSVALAEQAREAARAELEQSAAQFRRIVEGIPQLLWRATTAGQWTWASPQWTRFTGQPEAASHGRGWLEMVHPDDRRAARRAWRHAESAAAFEVEYRLRDNQEGRYRWFKTRAAPVRDETGAIVEWLGASTDIDDLQTVRDHERILLFELQHRVRNTLAVVRSIARRTAENSETIEDFAMHFDGRVDAFARTQSLVTRNPSHGVDLETLIAEELLAHHVREGEQATIGGPPVRLKPKVADTLGLAIHELATNAVKYGGLSGNDGKVSVVWTIEGSPKAPILVLIWRDSAPDGAAEPAGPAGFGSEVIERSLAYELDAQTGLSFDRHGAHCEIRLPLAGRTA